MSTATFNPPHTPQAPPVPGATATGAALHPAHHVGNAVRAVKVFVSTAFNVFVLGEYSEEASVKRR
ncbi:hypothetical protein [Streptomyces sp. NPDC051569]|uniref:hypothetical protein n=1 Tax=Streptomyces sp. NPDC051569 TaxID=3365661 RepID=UPI00379F2F72